MNEYQESILTRNEKKPKKEVYWFFVFLFLLVSVFSMSFLYFIYDEKFKDEIDINQNMTCINECPGCVCNLTCISDCPKQDCILDCADVNIYINKTI